MGFDRLYLRRQKTTRDNVHIGVLVLQQQTGSLSISRHSDSIVEALCLPASTSFSCPYPKRS